MQGFVVERDSYKIFPVGSEPAVRMKRFYGNTALLVLKPRHSQNYIGNPMKHGCADVKGYIRGNLSRTMSKSGLSALALSLWMSFSMASLMASLQACKSERV